MIAALLVLLAACDDWPREARPPTQDEAAAVADVVARWEPRIGPVSDECRDYMDRLHVIDASGEEIAEWCRMCPPSLDPWECDRVRWGAAGACSASIDETPIAVVWWGLDGVQVLSAVHHESTHLLGHCERPPGHYWVGHTDPALWGPDGVHPL